MNPTGWSGFILSLGDVADEKFRELWPYLSAPDLPEIGPKFHFLLLAFFGLQPLFLHDVDLGFFF